MPDEIKYFSASDLYDNLYKQKSVEEEEKKSILDRQPEPPQAPAGMRYSGIPEQRAAAEKAAAEQQRIKEEYEARIYKPRFAGLDVRAVGGRDFERESAKKLAMESKISVAPLQFNEDGSIDVGRNIDRGGIGAGFYDALIGSWTEGKIDPERYAGYHITQNSDDNTAVGDEWLEDQAILAERKARETYPDQPFDRERFKKQLKAFALAKSASNLAQMYDFGSDAHETVFQMVNGMPDEEKADFFEAMLNVSNEQQVQAGFFGRAWNAFYEKGFVETGEAISGASKQLGQWIGLIDEDTEQEKLDQAEIDFAEYLIERQRKTTSSTTNMFAATVEGAVGGGLEIAPGMIGGIGSGTLLKKGAETALKVGAKGAGRAAAIGSTTFWWAQSKDAIYDTMIENGASTDSANAVSSIAAIPVAAIERFQVKSVKSAWFKNLKPKQQQSLKQAFDVVKQRNTSMSQNFIQGGKHLWKGTKANTINAAKETAQEIAQESLTMIGEYIGNEINDLDVPIDVKGRIMDTWEATGASMFALGVTGRSFKNMKAGVDNLRGKGRKDNVLNRIATKAAIRETAGEEIANAITENISSGYQSEDEEERLASDRKVGIISEWVGDPSKENTEKLNRIKVPYEGENVGLGDFLTIAGKATGRKKAIEILRNSVGEKIGDKVVAGEVLQEKIDAIEKDLEVADGQAQKIVEAMMPYIAEDNKLKEDAIELVRAAKTSRNAFRDFILSDYDVFNPDGSINSEVPRGRMILSMMEAMQESERDAQQDADVLAQMEDGGKFISPSLLMQMEKGDFEKWAVGQGATQQELSVHSREKLIDKYSEWANTRDRLRFLLPTNLEKAGLKTNLQREAFSDKLHDALVDTVENVESDRNQEVQSFIEKLLQQKRKEDLRSVIQRQADELAVDQELEFEEGTEEAELLGEMREERVEQGELIAPESIQGVREVALRELESEGVSSGVVDQITQDLDAIDSRDPIKRNLSQQRVMAFLDNQSRDRKSRVAKKDFVQDEEQLKTAKQMGDQFRELVDAGYLENLTEWSDFDVEAMWDGSDLNTDAVFGTAVEVMLRQSRGEQLTDNQINEIIFEHHTGNKIQYRDTSKKKAKGKKGDKQDELFGQEQAKQAAEPRIVSAFDDIKQLANSVGKISTLISDQEADEEFNEIADDIIQTAIENNIDRESLGNELNNTNLHTGEKKIVMARYDDAVKAEEEVKEAEVVEDAFEGEDVEVSDELQPIGEVFHGSAVESGSRRSGYADLVKTAGRTSDRAVVAGGESELAADAREFGEAVNQHFVISRAANKNAINLSQTKGEADYTGRDTGSTHTIILPQKKKGAGTVSINPAKVIKQLNFESSARDYDAKESDERAEAPKLQLKNIKIADSIPQELAQQIADAIKSGKRVNIFYDPANQGKNIDVMSQVLDLLDSDTQWETTFATHAGGFDAKLVKVRFLKKGTERGAPNAESQFDISDQLVSPAKIDPKAGARIQPEVEQGADSFMEIYESETRAWPPMHQHTLREREWGEKGSGQMVDLQVVDENEVHLDMVSVPKSQQKSGLGTNIINRLAAIADETGTTITLELPEKAFTDGPNPDVLARWYEKFGFERVQGGMMSRSPSALAVEPDAVPEQKEQVPTKRKQKDIENEKFPDAETIEMSDLEMPRFGNALEQNRLTNEAQRVQSIAYFDTTGKKRIADVYQDLDSEGNKIYKIYREPLGDGDANMMLVKGVQKASTIEQAYDLLLKHKDVKNVTGLSKLEVKAPTLFQYENDAQRKEIYDLTQIATDELNSLVNDKIYFGQFDSLAGVKGNKYTPENVIRLVKREVGDNPDYAIILLDQIKTYVHLQKNELASIDETYLLYYGHAGKKPTLTQRKVLMDKGGTIGLSGTESGYGAGDKKRTTDPSHILVEAGNEAPYMYEDDAGFLGLNWDHAADIYYGQVELKEKLVQLRNEWMDPEYIIGQAQGFSPDFFYFDADENGEIKIYFEGEEVALGPEKETSEEDINAALLGAAAEQEESQQEAQVGPQIITNWETEQLEESLKTAAAYGNAYLDILGRDEDVPLLTSDQKFDSKLMDTANAVGDIGWQGGMSDEGSFVLQSIEGVELDTTASKGNQKKEVIISLVWNKPHDRYSVVTTYTDGTHYEQFVAINMGRHEWIEKQAKEMQGVDSVEDLEKGTINDLKWYKDQHRSHIEQARKVLPDSQFPSIVQAQYPDLFNKDFIKQEEVLEKAWVEEEIEQFDEALEIVVDDFIDNALLEANGDPKILRGLIKEALSDYEETLMNLVNSSDKIDNKVLKKLKTEDGVAWILDNWHGIVKRVVEARKEDLKRPESFLTAEEDKEVQDLKVTAGNLYAAVVRAQEEGNIEQAEKLLAAYEEAQDKAEEAERKYNEKYDPEAEIEETPKDRAERWDKEQAELEQRAPEQSPLADVDVNEMPDDFQLEQEVERPPQPKFDNTGKGSEKRMFEGMDADPDQMDLEFSRPFPKVNKKSPGFKKSPYLDRSEHVKKEDAIEFVPELTLTELLEAPETDRDISGLENYIKDLVPSIKSIEAFPDEKGYLGTFANGQKFNLFFKEYIPEESEPSPWDKLIQSRVAGLHERSMAETQGIHNIFISDYGITTGFEEVIIHEFLHAVQFGGGLSKEMQQEWMDLAIDAGYLDIDSYGSAGEAYIEAPVVLLTKEIAKRIREEQSQFKKDGPVTSLVRSIVNNIAKALKKLLVKIGIAPRDTKFYVDMWMDGLMLSEKASEVGKSVHQRGFIGPSKMTVQDPESSPYLEKKKELKKVKRAIARAAKKDLSEDLEYLMERRNELIVELEEIIRENARNIPGMRQEQMDIDGTVLENLAKEFDVEYDKLTRSWLKRRFKMKHAIARIVDRTNFAKTIKEAPENLTDFIFDLWDIPEKNSSKRMMMRQIREAKMGFMNYHNQLRARRLKDLDKARKKLTSKDLNPVLKEYFFRYFTGTKGLLNGMTIQDALLKYIPDQVKRESIKTALREYEAALNDARKHIDALAEEGINIGLFHRPDGDGINLLELTIDENLGYYINRSYAFFENPEIYNDFLQNTEQGQELIAATARSIQGERIEDEKMMAGAAAKRELFKKDGVFYKEGQLKRKKIRAEIKAVIKGLTQTPDGKITLSKERIEELREKMESDAFKKDGPKFKSIVTQEMARYKESMLETKEGKAEIERQLDQMERFTEQDALDEANRIVQNRKLAAMGGVSSAEQDLGILQERKHLNKAFLNLYGENRNVKTAYATTVGKMAQMISVYKLQQGVLKNGLFKGMIRPPGAGSRRNMQELIGPQWGPLQDHWVHEDALEVIKELSGQGNGTISKILKHDNVFSAVLLGAVAMSNAARMNKTVLSVKTVSRNMTEALMQGFINGSFSLSRLAESYATAMSISGEKNAALKWTMNPTVATLDTLLSFSKDYKVDDELAAFLVKTGVVGNDDWRVIQDQIAMTVARYEDANRMLPKDIEKEMEDKTILEKLSEIFKDKEDTGKLKPSKKTKKARRRRKFEKVISFITDNKLVREQGLMYRVPDDVLKINTFLTEVSILNRAYKGTVSRKKIWEEAAERTKRTTPTATRVPRAIRGLSAVPLVGNFPVWTTSFMQSVWGAYSVAYEDMKSGNPSLIRSGALRVARMGFLQAILPAAFSLFTSLLFDDEEEEDIRSMLPEWSKNHTILPLMVGDTLQVLDLTQTLPHVMFWDWGRAGVSGMKEGWDRDGALGAFHGGVSGAFEQFMDPYTDEDIFWQTIPEIMRGTNQFGKEIYSPFDSNWDKLIKSAEYVTIGGRARDGEFSLIDRDWRGPLAPGTLAEMRRTYEAFWNEGNPRSPIKRTKLGQASRFMIGTEIMQINVKNQLTVKYSEFKRKYNDYTAAIRRSGYSASSDIFESQLAEFRKEEQLLHKELLSTIGGARMAGMSDIEIVRALKEYGATNIDLRHWINGVSRDYVPGRDTLRSILATEGGEEKVKALIKRGDRNE